MSVEYVDRYDSEPERYEWSESRRYRFEVDRRDFIRLFGGGLLVVVAVSDVLAQESGPGGSAQSRRASPHERTPLVTVNGSEMFIEYGRPYTRGRKIFGSLIRWDEVWCPGADEATVLDSTRPLRIATLDVPAGPHTIWILPTASAWTLIVSKEPSGFHTRYNESADLCSVFFRAHGLSLSERH